VNVAQRRTTLDYMDWTMMEYEQATQGAAFFDLSDRSKVQLAGPDASIFLHNLCTNDVKNLPVGGGCEAFLTTAKAKIVAHFLVGRFQQLGRSELAAPILLLDMVPGTAAGVIKQLDHYLISEQVELADRTADLALLRLCGPKAAGILPGPLDDLPHLHHRQVRLAGRAVQVRRHDLLSVPAFDIFCATDDRAAIVDLLIAAGAVPASPETHDVLRIEAGLPEFGIDMDENRLVMEVGRTRQAISFTKGCFLGQEPIVMARDRGHVNRTLLRLQVVGSEPVAAGARVLHGDEEVGQVTSAAWSPRLQSTIALAYLKRGHQEPGKNLSVESPGGGRSAELLA
jgi:folate-binding protein YgfZ